MGKLTKNQKAVVAKVDSAKMYKLAEACQLVKEVSFTKFDASVELHVNLGVDPRKANQMIRGVVTLPYGTGKTKRVLVLCTPSVMAKVGAIGRILGPRGLMPNPKTGTVTMDVASAVKEVKAGKIDFKVDKTGIVHAAIGKVSFPAENILGNANELLSAILKLKPATLKGTYLQAVSICSTMSPGIHVDIKTIGSAE